MIVVQNAVPPDFRIILPGRPSGKIIVIEGHYKDRSRKLEASDSGGADLVITQTMLIKVNS